MRSYPAGIVHDGAVVVFYIVISVDFVELRRVGADVLIQDVDEIVAVASLHLVPQTERVTPLVNGHAKL